MQYSFGDFRLDTKDGVLENRHGEIHLRPKTLELLHVLLSSAPAVVSRQELLDRVWGTTFLSDDSLAQAISELRRVLGDDARSAKYVATVHRRGYRFVAEVSIVETGTAMEPTRTAVHTPARPGRAASLLLTAGLAAMAAAWFGLGATASSRVEREDADKRTAPSTERPQQNVENALRAASGDRYRLAATDCHTLGLSEEDAWMTVGLSGMFANYMARFPQVWAYPVLTLRPMLARSQLLGARGADGAARIHRLSDADLIVLCSLTELSDSHIQVELELWSGEGPERLASFSDTLTPGDISWQAGIWARQGARRVGLSVPRRRIAAPVATEAFASYYRGILLLDANPAEARAQFALAEEIQPGGRAAKAGMYRASRRLGDEKAMLELSRSLRHRRRGPLASLPHLLATGSVDEAIQLLKRKRRWSYDKPLLWLEVLQSASDKGQYNILLNALDRIRPSIRDSWLEPDFFLLEASSAKHLGDTERARRCATLALEASRDRGRTLPILQVAALESSLLD